MGFWLSRLRTPWTREPRETDDADLERELRSHLEAEIDEQLEAGVPPEEAQYAARRALGNVVLITEDTRAVWRSMTLEALMQDLGYALRTLRKSPAFTTVAVLSLALGIGANTAIFSILDGLILKTLPIKEPQQLFEIAMEGGGSKLARGLGGTGSFSNPLWEELRDDLPKTFSGAFAWTTPRFNLAKSGEAEYVNGVMASGGYFTTLGVPAILGRTFTAADDKRGGGPAGAVAVISYGFWQKQYAGDPGVIGRSLSLDGHPFVVIGVTPPSFFGTDVGRSFEVAVPLFAEAVIRGETSALDRRTSGWLALMGRLAPGVTREPARSSLRALSEVKELPARADSLRSGLATFLDLQPASGGRSALRRQYADALWLLSGVVAVVLLIACANIANLLLARAAARQREFAVRIAIGAGRFRLVRQLLTESLLIAAVGATLGVLFAQWGSRVLVQFLSTTSSPVALDTGVDLRMLAFTAAVTVLTVILFGLLPAFRASDVSPDAALKGSSRGSSGAPSRRRLGPALVVTQVGLSLVLLCGAGLFLGTLHNLTSVDTGFAQDNVLLVGLDARRTDQPGEQRAALYKNVLDALRAIPGVASASQAMITPISGNGWVNRADVAGYTPRSWQDATAFYNRVSDLYFETLRTPLLAGRDFNAWDTPRSPAVAVINEALARRFTGNPVGQSFSEGRSAFQVIGVVKDAKYRSLRDPAPPTAYVPMSQDNEPQVSTNYQIRSSGPALSMIPVVRTAVSGVDATLVISPKLFSTQVNEALIQERLIATLCVFFALLALLLAAIGLHGLVSYGVARRRSEIGIRVALGADRPTVLWLILRDVMLLTTLGTFLGLVSCSMLTRFVERMLYGLTPNDPLTLASASATLITIGVLAGYPPARRAASLQPMETLRDE